MSELVQVGESPVPRSPGDRPSLTAGERRDAPLVVGIERLFREIGTYLEFLDIARGT